MMDNGSEPEAERAIVVSVDSGGEIRVYGYGAVGLRAHEVGTLYMAALKLATTDG